LNEPLLDIAALFARSSVGYAVIGGHAVNVWLEPRFTASIDVTVVATPDELARLLAVLQSAGYHVERQLGAEQPSGPDFIRLRSNTGSVLEIQPAKTELQRELVRRAQRQSGSVVTATVEDLLILKLIAWRSKDRIDLEGLARLDGVDWAYVRRWCDSWEIGDRLSALRTLVGLPPL
jgi:hypothetical protein